MIFFLIFSTCLNAQEEPIRTIVLINGDAHMVDVAENGDLIAIYQKIERYFSLGESDRTIMARLSKTAEAEDANITFFEKEEEPVPSYTEENKKPIILGSSQYLGFSPQRALLLRKAVDQVRIISESYRAGDIQSIAITSYQENNYRSRSLARNRAKAIKDLLGAFGVPDSIISTRNIDVTPESKLDFVQVSF